jgi:hypothetical protein
MLVQDVKGLMVSGLLGRRWGQGVFEGQDQKTGKREWRMWGPTWGQVSGPPRKAGPTTAAADRITVAADGRLTGKRWCGTTEPLGPKVFDGHL